VGGDGGWKWWGERGQGPAVRLGMALRTYLQDRPLSLASNTSQNVHGLGSQRKKKNYTGICYGLDIIWWFNLSVASKAIKIEGTAHGALLLEGDGKLGAPWEGSLGVYSWREMWDPRPSFLSALAQDEITCSQPVYPHHSICTPGHGTKGQFLPACLCCLNFKLPRWCAQPTSLYKFVVLAVSLK
jgi:hypothetical protein